MSEVPLHAPQQEASRGGVRREEDTSLQLPSFGVVMGFCPYVSFDFPRWREVVVFTN